MMDSVWIHCLFDP